MSRILTLVSLWLLSFCDSVFGKAVEIEYWMWDSSQVSAYREAARVFESYNPEIEIKVQQIGWFDYWISLTASFIAESAPDVFVNHASRYPELAANGIVKDLAPYIERDEVDPSIYLPGLYEMWSREGKQYGLPKDWDTIAIVYNAEMLEEAGVKAADLEELEWNAENGGSFAEMLRRLTVDASGANGESSEFDSRRIKRHGLIIDGQPDGFGQVEWSHFAVSNGFRFHDGPWSQAFYYDDSTLAETFRWYRDASLEKGWIIPAREARQIGGAGLFSAKKGALLLSGSWMIGTYSKMCDFEYGYAPLPVGPNGRKTMFNGLADSVAAGTEHPEEAWKWVKFLGSREGQMIIAEAGVVFPAVREAAVRATEVMTSRGVDVSIFLEQAMDEDATFPFPITEHGSDIISISRAAMDEVVLGSGNVDTVLSTLDRDVDSLFQQ